MTNVPLTALGCSLICDDFSSDQTVQNANCPKCQRWFEWAQDASRRPPFFQLDGAGVSSEKCLEELKLLLRQAKRPAIFASGHLTSAQSHRVIDLAAQERALLTTHLTPANATLSSSISRHGASTCTMGEIAERCDVLFLWNINPEDDCPRLWERLRIKERSTARIYCLGSLPSQFPANVIHIPVTNQQEAQEALTSLQLLLNGQSLPSLDATWNDLASSLRDADYPVFLVSNHQSELHSPLISRLLLDLHLMLREHNRGFLVSLPSVAPALTTGAALLSRTGYPDAFDFAAIGPQMSESLSLETLLEQQEIDTLLVIADRLDRRVVDALSPSSKNLKVMVISPDADQSFPFPVKTSIACSPWDVPSFVLRFDGIPIPVRSVQESLRPKLTDLLIRLTT